MNRPTESTLTISETCAFSLESEIQHGNRAFYISLLSHFLIHILQSRDNFYKGQLGFGMWEETGAPGGNLHDHRENV